MCLFLCPRCEAEGYEILETYSHCIECNYFPEQHKGETVGSGLSLKKLACSNPYPQQDESDLGESPLSQVRP